jgi:hypothetical protein
LAGALHLLWPAAALCFDSFIAGMVLAPLIPPLYQRIIFALSCGLCDGVASFIGSLMPNAELNLPDWVVYVACVVLLLQGVRASRLWLFAIPFLFSLDNLAAGTQATEAGTLALGSAMMASVGLALGSLGDVSARGFFRSRLDGVAASVSFAAATRPEARSISPLSGGG